MPSTKHVPVVFLEREWPAASRLLERAASSPVELPPAAAGERDLHERVRALRTYLLASGQDESGRTLEVDDALDKLGLRLREYPWLSEAARRSLVHALVMQNK